jgi:hypothetical protein
MTQPKHSEKTPNGAAWAAILAAGIGCCALGLLIVLGERNPFFKEHLNFYDPVGNLSGKTSVGVAAWIVAWAVLYFRWKNRNLANTGGIMILTFILVFLGVCLSCPWVFDMFSSK